MNYLNLLCADCRGKRALATGCTVFVVHLTAHVHGSCTGITRRAPPSMLPPSKFCPDELSAVDRWALNINQQ